MSCTVDVNEMKLVYYMEGNCCHHSLNMLTGNVISSVPGSLEVYHCYMHKERTCGFLIVSGWKLHLIHHVTPVLLTPRGILVFMDIIRQCKVVVTLPYDIQQVEYQHFIAVLSSLSRIILDDKMIEQDCTKTSGEMIAQGIDKASGVISNGIGIGATKLSELVHVSSKYYCEVTCPANEDIQVNPNIKSGLEYARKGSHYLMEISGKAFGLLIRSTEYVASKVAPHIKSVADTVIPVEWKKFGDNGEKSTVDQIAVVAESTINGFCQLASSLHDGAVIFGRNFTRDSSNVMSHRYGSEVGHSTEHALYSAGNLGMVAFTAMSFTKKGFIKTAAQISATEVVSEYRKERYSNEKES